MAKYIVEHAMIWTMQLQREFDDAIKSIVKFLMKSPISMALPLEIEIGSFGFDSNDFVELNKYLAQFLMKWFSLWFNANSQWHVPGKYQWRLYASSTGWWKKREMNVNEGGKKTRVVNIGML